jgi:hypothetical protein
MHHRGAITITGPADELTVTGRDGAPLNLDRWPDHPANPRRQSHPGPDPSVNTSNGGGTPPSDPSHHQPLDVQSGWHTG